MTIIPQQDENDTETTLFNKLLNEFAGNFKVKERKDGTKYVANKVFISWQNDIIKAVCFNTPLKDYQWIRDISTGIAYKKPEDEDSAKWALYDIKPEKQTSNLTNWLNNDISRIDYIDKAIDNYDLNKGSKILFYAQKIWIEEIGYIIINGIQEWAEGQDS